MTRTLLAHPLLKCVIWDLDDTLWDGTLTEGDNVQIRPGMLNLIRRLDAAGVVQSVVSKNEHDNAMPVLQSLGVAQYFVYPRISWSAKSASVGQIVAFLNIGEDSVAFIDDSAFERAEVAESLPAISCYTLPGFLASDRLRHSLTQPVTSDAARRPVAYREEALRRSAEADFRGTSAEFLASLDMRLTVRKAEPRDLDRLGELMRRTHQLNSSGMIYSTGQMTAMADDDDRLVLVAELRDRFGDYGRIGLCVMTRRTDHCLIDLLLLSCRVAGRNVSRAFLGTIGGITAAGLELRALYRANGRNRQMQITLAFTSFVPVRTEQDVITYVHPDPGAILCPSYLKIACSAGWARPGALITTTMPQGGGLQWSSL